MVILETEPGKWGSGRTVVRSGKEEITRLEITAWKRRGSFTLEGEDYTIEPSGILAIKAQLKKGSTLIARAEQSSPWRRTFAITSAGHKLTLESRSLNGREFCLLVGAQEMGTVKRVGLMGKKIRLEFPDEVPMVLQLFLTYLVLRQARRDAAAGSAGS